MRVHGDKVIRRREGVAGLRNYPEARDMLKDDFCNLCGYCGKDCVLMHERCHIDHFVPQSIDPDRKNDYDNLVLACVKCNLSKSNKWPTKDKKITHDDRIGFVDPASDEFDIHMERDEQGYIRGITPLGQNMCENLNFHIRRTDLYWKIRQMNQIQEELERLFYEDKLQEEEKDYYIKVNIILKEYIQSAFEAGE